MMKAKIKRKDQSHSNIFGRKEIQINKHVHARHRLSVFHTLIISAYLEQTIPASIYLGHFTSFSWLKTVKRARFYERKKHD